ncbi:glycosyltransferase family 4 protein [Curvivirga sp.]|uniref:glycosyltransferase family 4 protein n=1 Tax=Curvivirga sp. TaxID=2856848 RepID=UPI003B59B1CF
MTVNKDKRILMVIVPDRPSEILEKGEFCRRYYNPGDLFDEVHLVVTNDDCPNLELMQRTVGEAKLFIHHYIPRGGLYLFSCLFNPILLRFWARDFVALVRNIQPDLVRCHGADLNAFLGSELKRCLGIPLLISIHTNPDADPTRWKNKGIWRLIENAMDRLAGYTMRNADLVMPVYSPAIPYLKRHKVKNISVKYNVINPESIQRKTCYKSKDVFRIVSVGRLIQGKNPEHIITALTRLPQNIIIDFVSGHGSLIPQLKEQVKELGLDDRVNFHPPLPNDELCAILPDYDLFVVHSDYAEISKSVLEALLTGLPVVINRNSEIEIPEFTNDICYMVENDPISYGAAISTLMNNAEMREQLGNNAYKIARSRWSPKKCEEEYKNVYEKFIDQKAFSKK